MTTAKIVKLTASPSAWANLSFEVGGIVQASNVTLGQAVQAYDFVSLYSTLGVNTEEIFLPVGESTVLGSATPATPENRRSGWVPVLADLLNSNDLGSAVGESALMSLRAESIKAMLDKAVALRANIYYAKFANQGDIIGRMQANLSAANTYLQSLANLSTTQFNDLSYAYNVSGKGGVVTNTSSHLDATVTGTTTANNTVTTSKDGQDMSYEDYGYRMPLLELTAQNTRAQLSLMAEQFAQFMAGQTSDNLAAVFTNELAAIDMDVKRLQVAYINTILMPPVSGTVTGIYKQVGEAVLPGETVMRIEDTSTIYLIGTLICPQMVSLGSAVTIQANLFSSGADATLSGSVIATRGDDHGDDWWNVVISCPNSGAGGSPILAPNYTFDYEDTTVTIA